MIEYRTDSIFESPAFTLTNTVNLVGVMGKGLALQFKAKYPELFIDYHSECHKKSTERKIGVGLPWLWRSEAKQVLCFPTKRHWRDGSILADIEQGLKLLEETHRDSDGWGLKSLAVPKLGCNLGGLDWEKQVKPLVDKYLSNLAIPIYVHV